MESIQHIWPKWELVELLGEGGFGKVYKAKRVLMNEVSYSAVKIVRIPKNDAELKEMTTQGMSEAHLKSYYDHTVQSFVNEIKVMESLKSANNIVGIEDYEVEKNPNGIGCTIYIRMELLTNLADYMSEHPMNYADIIKLGMDISNALMYCHQNNIIHRDIKPANIFVNKFGDFKLGDFGVSKEVEQSMAAMSQKGTKSYMAPEMIRLEKYDHTVDFYALGLTLYELFNHGRMPFLPKYPEIFSPMQREEATLKRLKGEDFPAIEGIGEVNDIIQKACHFNPKMRYRQAKELYDALANCSYIEHQEVLEEIIKDIPSITNNDNITIGIFGNGPIGENNSIGKNISLFGDVNIIDDHFFSNDEPYWIKHNKRYYDLVFKHGYCKDKHIHIISEDEKTIQLKQLFIEYLKGTQQKNTLKKMIELDEHPRLYYLLGKEYIKSSSKKYAREAFQKAYDLDSEDFYIGKCLAIALYENKQYPKALEIMEKAIQIYFDHANEYPKKDVEMLVCYAVILHMNKKHQEALQVVLEAQQFIKSYRFDWHLQKSVTRSVIFAQLYGVEPIVDEFDFLMNAVRYVGIGLPIYSKIFKNEAKRLNYKIPFEENAKKFHQPSDLLVEVYKNLMNNYGVGCMNLYHWKGLLTMDFYTIALFEFHHFDDVEYMIKGFSFKKYNTTITIKLKHELLFDESIHQIIRLNEKLIKEIEPRRKWGD